MEDKYVLYCLGSGIDSEFFWHEPIASVERVYQGKMAYDAWRMNPQER